MGSDPGLDPLAFDNEHWLDTGGRATVELPTLYVGRYEVTVAQFRAFVEATGYRADPAAVAGLADHPVVAVSWTDALSYVRWLEGQLRGRLDQSSQPPPHYTGDCSLIDSPECLTTVDRFRYGWGSRKIRKLTAEKFGSAPARRTIDRIFERHDLITKKRRRSGKPSHPGKPLTPMDEPNAVWTVDFKGQFKMLNDRYCCPLTIQDGFSRLLLECRGLYSTSIELAKPVFIKVFREFGLPEAQCRATTPLLHRRDSDR